MFVHTNYCVKLKTFSKHNFRVCCATNYYWTEYSCKLKFLWT